MSLIHRREKRTNEEGGATHRSLEDADLFPEGLVLLPQFGDAVLELVDASLQQEVNSISISGRLYQLSFELNIHVSVHRDIIQENDQKDATV